MSPRNRWLAQIAVGFALATPVVSNVNRRAVESKAELDQEHHRLDNLDAILAAQRTRFDLRLELAQGLIDGRLTAADALARYWPLTAASWRLPQGTPAEKRATEAVALRGLLLDVAYALRDDPARLEAELARLRAELARHQADQDLPPNR